MNGRVVMIACAKWLGRTHDTCTRKPDGCICEKEYNMEEKDELILKWGTLKGWHMHSDKGQELLKKYHDLGASPSAMLQRDTPEQKELICQIIDECNAETIYLDWDGKYISKDVAKKYIREYQR